MRANDRIRIIESAYSMEGTHQEWQRDVTAMVQAVWGDESYSYSFDASDVGAFSLGCFASVDSELAEKAERALRLMRPPEPVLRTLHTQAPHLKYTVEPLGPEVYEADWAQATLAAFPDVVSFALGLITLDPSGRGVCFALRSENWAPIAERTRHVWSRVASHIGIAYRLRRALEDTVEGALGDAVLDLDGACLHAEGDATDTSAREYLREAARRVMRARGSLRRRDPDEALEIWQGLVDGRWSLVDRFESDGKHYLVAHRNPPEVRDPRALTAREAQVASYLPMGFTNKLIGYALGISTSAVADHVSSLSRKLNASSRVDLVRVLDSFGS